MYPKLSTWKTSLSLEASMPSDTGCQGILKERTCPYLLLVGNVSLLLDTDGTL